MSPTLAAVGIRTHKTITTTFTVLFLGLWVLQLAGFTALDVLEEDPSYLDSFLSISLLTYLICRLIVFFQGYNRDGSMAYRLTSAHHRHSRKEALLSTIFSLGWIYSLLCKFFLMFISTFMSSIILVSHYYGDDIVQAEKDGLIEDKGQMDFATAMEKMEEYQEALGFDAVELFAWIPWQLLIGLAVVAWITFGTLFFYVVRVAWKSVVVVFRIPQEKSVAPKLYVA